MTIVDKIIASLRDEPRQWHGYKSGQGVVTLMNRPEFGSFATPDSWYWGEAEWNQRQTNLGFIARFRLRLAIRKWQRRVM